MLWPILLVIARVLGDGDSLVPDLEDRAVLLIKRHDVMVGCGTDGGVSDAGVDGMPGDAPLDAPPDASLDDAGVPDDAGMSPDAGTTCTTIQGDAITMIIQPRVVDHLSSGTHFAMLLVTPSRPVVEATTPQFASLDAATAAEVVTTEVEVEDPSLGKQCEDYGCASQSSGGGCDMADTPSTWNPPDFGDTDDSDGGVAVETIGPYQVLRVQPTDRAQLVAWLDQTGFAYAPEDVDAVVPYLARSYHVVAVRLTVAAPMKGATVPLAITWAGSELRLPLALSASRDPGSSLTAYIAADGTYTFPGARVAYSGPTGYGNAYVTRNEISIPSMTSPDQDPIATRVYPDVYYRDTIEHVVEVRVPVTVTCEDYEDEGCCTDCSTRRRVRVDWVVLAVAVLLVVRRRRR